MNKFLHAHYSVINFAAEAMDQHQDSGPFVLTNVIGLQTPGHLP